MPIERVSFECRFRPDGCGKALYRTKGGAVKHEARCIRNPEVKACPTCRHNRFDAYKGDDEPYGFRCEIDALPVESETGHRNTMAFGCAKWEAKGGEA